MKKKRRTHKPTERSYRRRKPLPTLTSVHHVEIQSTPRFSLSYYILEVLIIVVTATALGYYLCQNLH